VRWVAAFLVGLAGVIAPASEAAGATRGTPVKVMTRNLYLGSDLNGALAATSPAGLISEAGEILRDVDANRPAQRMSALGAEILRKKPDLVGMQEVAWFRTNPTPSVGPALGGAKTATATKYNYLSLLLARLNRGAKRYRVVISQTEGDIEAPADYDGNPATGNPLLAGADLNARLTIRDVILARRGPGVRTRNAQGGHFVHLFQATVAGTAVPVERGWTRVDANVRGSGFFRFVDTHLESEAPTIREAQAKELFAAGGPARSRGPIVLLGDLNSDDDTVQGADRLAYRALLGAGFRERSTANPLSCCIDAEILTGGSVADFDHQVDHVMTPTPRRVRLANSSVSGRSRVGGLFPSDHAGVFSTLLIR
jgi:endonuclease/exonuclease/phosphatase family metal-dependent hydrolase